MSEQREEVVSDVREKLAGLTSLIASAIDLSDWEEFQQELNAMEIEFLQRMKLDLIASRAAILHAIESYKDRTDDT